MQLKPFVILSSFLLLTILVVCVSVYAFNAHCTASRDGCSATASANGWGLFNGYYNLYARVGGDTDHKSGGFANGQNFSDTASASASECQEGEGSASASVTGTDAQGRIHHRNDAASF